MRIPLTIEAYKETAHNMMKLMFHDCRHMRIPLTIEAYKETAHNMMKLMFHDCRHMHIPLTMDVYDGGCPQHDEVSVS